MQHIGRIRGCSCTLVLLLLCFLFSCTHTLQVRHTSHTQSCTKPEVSFHHVGMTACHRCCVPLHPQYCAIVIPLLKVCALFKYHFCLELATKALHAVICSMVGCLHCIGAKLICGKATAGSRLSQQRRLQHCFVQRRLGLVA